MPRRVRVSRDMIEKAKQALNNFKDSKVYIRLLAIIKSEEKPLGEVASFFNVHYTTVSKWIKRFEAEGVEGLKDKYKGNNPRKLSDEPLETIRHWLEGEVDPEGNPIHWTLEKLKATIKRVFDISIGIGPLWGYLQRMGYRHKTVRPVHEKKPDQSVIEAFKKTLGNWSTSF